LAFREEPGGKKKRVRGKESARSEIDCNCLQNRKEKIILKISIRLVFDHQKIMN